MVKSLKITVEDIEEVVGFKISEHCKERVIKFDLTYRELTKEERDEVVLDILNTLNEEVDFVGKHRLDKWENGWYENLKLFKQDNNIDSLIPKYFNKYSVARWKGDFVKYETEFFDYKLHTILVDAILHKYVGCNYSNLYEFGCGPAYHLLRFSNFNTECKLVGLDWTKASQEIIKEINESGINTKITGYNFDYFKPDYNLDILPNSAIFTCASLEQIGDNYKEFIDYLLVKRPEICIHFEPEAEILNSKSLVDRLSVMYFKKRKYLNGLLTYLRRLQEEGKIEMEYKRLWGGSYFIEGYPVLIWKIKK